MFYSDTILSRRGPLGKVWLAAHMERKLSKTQTLQTDIEQSVDVIMGHEIEVMALRLSGQLLLGVVRIYSRKAKYLLDDCNEALLKIKMAFRPGLVDVTDDELVVSKNSITLAPNMVDLDILLPDVHWDLDFEHRSQQHIGHHQAHVDDITLRTADDFQNLDPNPFDVGPSDGIGSQDFYHVDLGIDLDGDHPFATKDDLSSLGVGRHVSRGVSLSTDRHTEIRAASLLSDGMLSHPSPGRSAGALDFEPPLFESVDLGEFGVGFDEQDTRETEGRSRASSPLTELPLTPQNITVEIGHGEEGGIERKRTKEKKQIVDLVTELQDDGAGRFTRPGNFQDAHDTIADHQFLRNSSIMLRLLEVHLNPTAHFFHSKTKHQGSYNCGAPYGIGPELKQLFMRPIGRTSSGKRSLPSPERLSSKRPRTQNRDNIPQLEFGRRDASPVGSLRLGSELLEPSFDLDGYQTTHIHDDMDIQMVTAEPEPVLPLLHLRSRSPPHMEGRASLPASGQGTVADELANETFLSAFETGYLHPSQSEFPDVDVDVDTIVDIKGFSKNTMKALEIIRNEDLASRPAGTQKVLSFGTISNRASRRAASSFFFELLVLGTRDCLKLSQPAPFEDIEFRTKENFWTMLSSYPGK